MKRLLIALALCVVWAASAAAQTTVNLTVTDTPDNQLWTNGTWAVKLQPPTGNLSQTSSFTILSGGGSLAGQSGALSASATASISLPANANIGPSGTVWQFTVCPQASAGCFQQSVTVSTSSPQTLNLTPPSIRINLATATPPVSAYSTGEINGASLGSQFMLIGTGEQFCTVVSGNTCTTWVSGGGSSFPVTTPVTVGSGGSITTTGTGTISATSNTQISGPLVIYPAGPPYNISFDGKVSYNCSWPNASTSVTCTSGTQLAAGSAAVAANVATITFGQPYIFNPIAQGWVVGDTIVVSGFTGADTFYNGTFTTTAQTANSVSWALVHANASSTTTADIQNSNRGPFLSTDTGKLAFGTNCNTALLCYLAPGGNATRPIGALTYVSPTSVTVAGNSTAIMNTGVGSFYWFTDDRAKWGVDGTVAGTVAYAIANAPGCVSVISPAGMSPIPSGLGNINNTNCGLVGGTGRGTGSRQYDAGNNWWGQGIANTVFLLPPDFDWTKCTGNGASTSTCLMSAFMGGGNFTMTGGGHCQTGTNAAVIWSPSVSATWWDKVSLTNFACADASASNIGAYYGFSNKYTGIYVDAFGANTCRVAGLNVDLSDSYCGESRTSPLIIVGANTVARFRNMYLGATLSTIGIWLQNSGGIRAYFTHSQNYGAVASGGTQIYVDNGATLYLDGWYGGNTAYDLELNAQGIAYVTDSRFSASTHCIGTNGVVLTTGSMNDQGGNTCTTANMEATLVPTCAMTTGGGTGPACTVVAGSTNEKGTIRMTPGTTPGTNGTTTMTFAGTFAGVNALAPSCSIDLANTGTGAWNLAANSQIQSRSTTVPVFLWNNTAALTAASTYDMDYVCVAK